METNSRLALDTNNDLARKHYATGIALFILTIVMRFGVALFLYGRETGDTYYFRVLADTVLAGGSPYDLPWQYAAYPPFWLLYIPAGLRAWGNILGLSFDLMIKTLPMFMDGAISLLIYLALIDQKCGRKTAIGWSMLYALNPLATFNNSVTGQIDSLPIVLQRKVGRQSSKLSQFCLAMRAISDKITFLVIPHSV